MLARHYFLLVVPTSRHITNFAHSLSMMKFSIYRVIFPAFLLASQGFRANAYQFTHGSLSQLSTFNRRISFSARCSAADTNGDAAFTGSKIVFVGNLPFDYSEAELKSLVLSKGVKGCAATRIATNKKSGMSRGFGYVDFDSEESAANSLNLLDGLEVNGRALKIDLDGGVNTPTKGRRLPPTSFEFSVFIGNLDFGVTVDDVNALVKSIIGDDAPFKVRFSYTMESEFRGFGHIDFGSEEAVTKVIDALNEFEMMGRALIVDRAEGKKVRVAEESRRRAFEGAMGPGGPSDQHSIFLGNLAWDVSIESIVELMDKLLGKGNVKAVRLSTDRETGQMKGFGHADFDTAEDAFQAASKLNGADLLGRALKADVAVPKARVFNDEGGSRGGRGGGESRGGGGGDDAWGDSAGPRLGGAVSSGRGGGGGGGGGSARGEGSYGRGSGGRGGYSSPGGERSSFGGGRGGGGRGQGSRDGDSRGGGRGRGSRDGDSRGGGRGGGRGRGRGGGGGYSSGADTGSFGAW